MINLRLIMNILSIFKLATLLWNTFRVFSSPLERVDVMGAENVPRKIQCNNLCWYRKACQSYNFHLQPDQLVRAGDVTCVLHTHHGKL